VTRTLASTFAAVAHQMRVAKDDKVSRVRATGEAPLGDVGVVFRALTVGIYASVRPTDNWTSPTCRSTTPRERKRRKVKKKKRLAGRRSARLKRRWVHLARPRNGSNRQPANALG
jgi:hypothetical protein